MDEQFKRRLVGAAVLASLAVIFIPMLFDEESKIEAPLYQTQMPVRPAQPFESKLLKDEIPAVDTISREAPVEVKVGKDEPNAAPVTRVGLRAWVVQVGSFSDRKNASQLVTKLRAAGFEAFLEDAQVAGKDVFRVRIGPEADRVRADALLPQVKAAVGLDGSVKRYP